MGTHAVIEHCNLLIQKGGSLIEASCAEIPSQEAVRQAIKKRYQIAVTLSPWQRTAANGWVAIVTSELTTRK
jgi:hypothetical protein